MANPRPYQRIGDIGSDPNDYDQSKDLHALAFDGVDDRMTTAYTRTQPHSLSFAMRTVNFANTKPFDGLGNNNASIFMLSNGDIRAYAGQGVVVPAAVSSAAPFVGSALFSGVNSYMRHNGTQVSGDAGSINATGLALGYSEVAGEASDGQFYGVIARNGAPDNSELSNIESYLSAKSGVTL